MPLFRDKTHATPSRAALETALVDLWRESSSAPERILAAALVVLCDFYQKHLDVARIHRVWWRLVHMVRGLPESDAPVTVRHADARNLPLESDSVDLVLTSPPYINVFNYHQKFRCSVEALEWAVLAVARSEIGSNRQNRSNRFRTVVQYCLDMALALREAVRVTKAGSPLMWILGRESAVRGTAFFNGELVAELAVCSLGLTLHMRQERRFRNRYGIDIYEDILHFRATPALPGEDCCLQAARRIARQVLTAAWSHAPRHERPSLAQTLERLAEILPSPPLSASPPP